MPLIGRTYSVSEIITSAKGVLPQQLGSNLECLVHFGNHVDPTLSATRSDKIQLLIVIKDMNGSTLTQLANAFSQVSGAAQIGPMVMTRLELERSTDVFPTTFLEMKHYHERLAGEDVLENLEIKSSFLRLRCEQELKNLLLRLQANYVTLSGHTRKLRALFHSGFQSLVRTLHAVQVLFDKPFTQSREDLLRSASEQLQLDLPLFERLSQFDNQPSSMSLDSVREWVGSLIELVSGAADGVDQMPTEVELLEMIEE